MVAFIIWLVGGTLALYLGILVYMFLRQRSLQYFPTHQDAAAEGNTDFEVWKSDQGEFAGYWRPVERPKRIVILFHGNAGEALDRYWIAEVVPADHLLILAEYPGFGAMPGSPTQAGIFEGALKLVEQVQKRWDVPMTVVGESLGSGVAVYVASKKKVDKLALISPFYSAAEIAAAAYPFLPVKLLMQDKFLSCDYAKTATASMQILHGTLDDVIPVASARKLFACYGGTTKSFNEIPGYGHSNMAEAVVDSPFADTFRSFLS